MSTHGDTLRKALELGLQPSGACPGGEALYRLAAGTCPSDERGRLEDHVLACTACMETWRETRALLRGSSEGLPQAKTPVPLHAPRPRGRLGRPWVPAALAAAFAGVLAAGGWATLNWFSLRRENLALKGETARASRPSVAILLDLSPESLRMRGAEPQVPALERSTLPSALVLNPMAPYKVPVDVLILDEEGRAIWSATISPPPPGPVTLLIPAALLPCGLYVAEVRPAGTQKSLDRFRFEVH
jgi:hypothetical protein